ncbi:MAG TPA: hypothetical protein VFJ85_11465 [Acidimicrobiales bacterium]|nr:hypothetical protein [Acidimicrobiales bacterium]
MDIAIAAIQAGSGHLFNAGFFTAMALLTISRQAVMVGTGYRPEDSQGLPRAERLRPVPMGFVVYQACEGCVYLAVAAVGAVALIHGLRGSQVPAVVILTLSTALLAALLLSGSALMVRGRSGTV